MVQNKNIILFLGISASLAYLIVILSTWISANYLGYVYFSVGEPNKIIKYVEWFFGLIAITTLIYLLSKIELIPENHYDQPL